MERETADEEAMLRRGHGLLGAAVFMATAGVVCAVLFIATSSSPVQHTVVLKQTQLADIWDSYKDNQNGGTFGSISYGTGTFWRGGDDWGVPQVLDCGPMANECNVHPTGNDFYATSKRMPHRANAMMKSSGGARLQSLAQTSSPSSKHQQAHSKAGEQLSAAQKLQLVMRGLDDGGSAESNDSMESIEERAAHKVSRWMGGGYVKVYDLGSGR